MSKTNKLPVFLPPPPQPAQAFVRSLVESVDQWPQVLKGGWADLEAAVKAAVAEEIPQFTEWNVTTAESFLNFAQGMLSWVPSENAQGRDIYYVLCLFYFVLDQEPINAQQTPISPSSVINGVTQMTPVSTWMVQYAQQMGNFMDKPESLTPKSWQSFQLSPSYNVSECAANFSDPRGGFQNFNQLFSRKLKTGTRPIWKPDDNSQVIFPADSTFDDYFPVDGNNVVNIKGLPWKISDLLVGSQYAGHFTGGTWMHAFLSPADYHRQHAPVSGRIVEAFDIPGLAYLNVIAQEQPDGTKAVVPVRSFDAPDNPGYEFIQLRGCIIIGTQNMGLVAVLPIGMAQVSSVILDCKKGDTVKKGDNISHFEFGGSDIVVVFEKRANITFNATPSRPGPNGEPDYYPGEHGLVGHLLATANVKEE